MTGTEKPKSVVATGYIIFILGILFTLFSAFLILGTTVFKEQFSETISQYLGYESFTAFLTIFILLIFRAVYHLVMGIALAKGRNWGRMWFLWLSLVEIFLGLFSLDLIDAVRAGIFLIFLLILTRPAFTGYLGKVKIPFKYTFRSLFTRPLTTILTILGISFVAFIFCMILMLADGIAKVLVSTGEKDNVMFMEEDQFSEIQSNLMPEEVDMIENLGYYAFDPEIGEQLFSPELVASISLPTKDDTTKLKNLTMRGVVEIAPKLRRNFKLLDGEVYQMGLPTCIVGSSTAKRFAHCRIGDSINIAGDYFQVVGVFETGGTAYDSEIWADMYRIRMTWRNWKPNWRRCRIWRSKDFWSRITMPVNRKTRLHS